jgi:hypothetical protein
MHTRASTATRECVHMHVDTDSLSPAGNPGVAIHLVYNNEASPARHSVSLKGRNTGPASGAHTLAQTKDSAGARKSMVGPLKGPL